MTAIPLVDLRLQTEQILTEVRTGFDRVLERSAFVLGDEVATFEAAYTRFAGIRHCVGVANGTDALELALRAVGVVPGDEVILPANTFIATALAVARVGATPVLVDVDSIWQLIDVDAVSSRIAARTRAVVPVHLFGQVAPMERLVALARKAGLKIVEDAAQAQGATQYGVAAGGFGDAAGTSFYPSKNLGAFGDAGAVLTNDDSVAATVRALRNYGSNVKYHHPETGFNSRLDTLQAVVLSAKLARLEGWNDDRRKAASRYAELLAGVDDVELPAVMDGNDHVWYLYVIRVPHRDSVLRRLRQSGIGVGVHYPVPIHLQGAFAALGHREGDFPVTEAAARTILSLPMFPGITLEQQERVVDVLRQALP